MVGETHNDAIARRGFAEALACQDMLERVSVQPPLLARVVAWLVTRVRALADRDAARGRRVTTAARSSVP